EPTLSQLQHGDDLRVDALAFGDPHVRLCGRRAQLVHDPVRAWTNQGDREEVTLRDGFRVVHHHALLSLSDLCDDHGVGPGPARGVEGYDAAHRQLAPGRWFATTAASRASALACTSGCVAGLRHVDVHLLVRPTEADVDAVDACGPASCHGNLVRSRLREP